MHAANKDSDSPLTKEWSDSYRRLSDETPCCAVLVPTLIAR